MIIAEWIGDCWIGRIIFIYLQDHAAPDEKTPEQAECVLPSGPTADYAV